MVTAGGRGDSKSSLQWWTKKSGPLLVKRTNGEAQQGACSAQLHSRGIFQIIVWVKQQRSAFFFKHGIEVELYRTQSRTSVAPPLTCKEPDKWHIQFYNFWKTEIPVNSLSSLPGCLLHADIEWWDGERAKQAAGRCERRDCGVQNYPSTERHTGQCVSQGTSSPVIGASLLEALVGSATSGRKQQQLLEHFLKKGSYGVQWHCVFLKVLELNLVEPHSLLIHIVTLCWLQDTGTCCLNVIDFKRIFANSRTAVFHVENKAAFQWEMTEALQLGRMEPIDLVWKVAMQKDGNKQRGRLALVEVITETWGLAETKRITNQRACVGTNTWDEEELAEEQKILEFVDLILFSSSFSGLAGSRSSTHVCKMLGCSAAMTAKIHFTYCMNSSVASFSWSNAIPSTNNLRNCSFFFFFWT